MAGFNTAAFPDSLALGKQDSLLIGTIDEIQVNAGHGRKACLCSGMSQSVLFQSVMLADSAGRAAAPVLCSVGQSCEACQSFQRAVYAAERRYGHQPPAESGGIEWAVGLPNKQAPLVNGASRPCLSLPLTLPPAEAAHPHGAAGGAAAADRAPGGLPHLCGHMHAGNHGARWGSCGG